MRMHRDFLSGLHSNVKHSNVGIFEYYFVGLRPSVPATKNKAAVADRTPGSICSSA